MMIRTTPEGNNGSKDTARGIYEGIKLNGNHMVGINTVEDVCFYPVGSGWELDR
jgi:hypothetical protein